MGSHSMPVLCLKILVFVLLKMSTVVGTEHCIGPIDPVQVVGIRVVPERGDANFIKMKLRSRYELVVDLRMDGTPIVVKDKMVDDSLTQATISQDGDDYDIIISSLKGVNTSSLTLGIRSQHPCNTVIIWLHFVVFRHMFEEGISIPTPSVFPKSSYRLDKDDSIQLRYGITYKDDGQLRHNAMNDYVFKPFYFWNETNILYSPLANDAPKVKSEPRKVEIRQTNSTKNGFITLTSELELQPGPSFPLDGAVLIALKTFVVDPDVFNSKESYMYVFTSLQFTDNSDGLPMRVESLVATEHLLQLGYQKQEGLNMLIVGLNYRIPEGRRGISCVAVGLDRAPIVVAARLTSTNGVKGDITDVKLLDNHFWSPQMVGVLGSTEFKVNLPIGSEAYYVCSASTGEKVTTTIIKVVSIVPLEVAIEDGREVVIENGRGFQEERYEGTCTASGDPKPLIRLFLVPGGSVVWGNPNDGQVPEQYQSYELTDSTSQVNVTSTSADSYTTATTVSFYWADMDGYAFNLECYASNVQQVEKTTSYLYNDAYNTY